MTNINLFNFAEAISDDTDTSAKNLVLGKKVYEFDLSYRLRTCLRDAHVSSIGELANMSEKDLLSISRFNWETLREVKILLNKLGLVLKNEQCKLSPIQADDSRLLKKIEELGLPVRSERYLRNANIQFVGELVQMTEADLLEIPKAFAKKSLNKIRVKLEENGLTLGMKVLGWPPENLSHFENVINGADSRLLKQINEMDLSYRTRKCLEAFNITWLGELVQKTEENMLKIPNFGRKSLNEIKIKLDGMGLELGMSVLGWPPEHMNDLVKQQQIENAISLEECIEKIEHYVRTHFTDVEKDVYYQRISRVHGATLQALADKYRVTRERIRQIEVKTTNKILCILQQHISTLDNIIAEFGSIVDYGVNDGHKEVDSLRTHCELLYNLLNIRGTYAIDLKKRWFYNPADLPVFSVKNSNMYSQEELIEYIHKVLTDVIKDKDFVSKTNFNSILNKYVKQIVFDNFIFIDGKRTENNRNAVFRRFLSQPQYCTTPTRLEVLFEEYTSFLTRNNMDLKKYGYPKYTSFCSMIVERKDVLLSFGRKVRYYDYNNFDIKRLVAQLNFDDYKNIEISSNKIFAENSELMSEYGILNGYELHNLLKKHCVYEAADFSRMPNIKFGNADRKQQVCNFARTIAPIKLLDLAVAYEDAFGITQHTFMADYIQYLQEYLYNGMVIFDEIENISGYERNLIITELTKEFYFIHDVERVFKRIFADDYKKYMCRAVLRSLGFYMTPQYILSEKYVSIREYINEKFDNMPILDLNFYKEYRTLKGFDNWFYRKRSEGELIKFSDNKYISSIALSKAGITKDIIAEYIRQVLECAQNRFFTIYSISNISHDFALENFGFEDVFYEDIIMKYSDTAFTKVKNTILFKNSKTPISFADFICSLMEHLRKINIYDLCAKLREEYGLFVNKSDITRLVDETDLYYNNITENLYVTYDEFITSF